MEIWPFIQQNVISILSAIVATVGVYFGARSYYLSERKKQNEEINRIKQLLVGSSEVSVQNLTEVIESLRSRVDRLEDDRSRMQKRLEQERERAEGLAEEKSKLLDEMKSARKRADKMKEETRRLSRELDTARDEIEALRDGRLVSLAFPSGLEWSPPPFRQQRT